MECIHQVERQMRFLTFRTVQIAKIWTQPFHQNQTQHMVIQQRKFNYADLLTSTSDFNNIPFGG